MLSGMCSGAALPGGRCRTTCRRGRPSTTTSGAGASMAPGSGPTRTSESRCGCVQGERPLPLRPSWIVSPHHRKRGVRGYDGAKKLSGRKRHLLVDTGGLVLRAVVHPANIPDQEGARRVLATVPEAFPALRQIWVDAGYRGALLAWAEQVLDVTLIVVKRPSRWMRLPADQEPPPLPAGFPVLPRRWVVERTFAWLGRYRRLSKDYEQLPTTEEAWIFAAMIQLMVHRLAQ
jgi:transposase